MNNPKPLPSIQQIQSGMHWWNSLTQEQKDVLMHRNGRTALSSAVNIARFWLEHIEGASDATQR